MFQKGAYRNLKTKKERKRAGRMRVRVLWTARLRSRKARSGRVLQRERQRKRNLKRKREKRCSGQRDSKRSDIYSRKAGLEHALPRERQRKRSLKREKERCQDINSFIIADLFHRIAFVQFLVLYNAPWIKGLEPSLVELKDSC